MIQHVVEFVRTLTEAFQTARAGHPPARSSRPNSYPQCPACFRRVPALCQDAEEGAEPCGNGLMCCCSGPHVAPKNTKGEDGGKFQTSVERA